MHRFLSGIFVVATAAGCTASRGPKSTDSNDPAVKIPAMQAAVQDKDLSSAKHMVEGLDSDDAAVRFYAIQGLERLTGQTFGYRYFDDDAERRPAVAQWKEWLAKQ